MKIFAFLSGLLLSVNISAKIKKPNINTDLSIYGFNADSSQVAATKGGMRLGFAAKGTINDFISYQGRMNFFFEEGAHSSLNNDSYTTASTYGIEEGYITLAPIHFFDASIGVKKFVNSNNPLFIDIPGIGSNQNIHLVDYDNVKFDLYAYENIVSTNSTQQRTGSLQDRNPYFIVLGANLVFDNDFINLQGRAQSFTFERLSSDVANKSRYRGASSKVTGTGEASKFTEDFKGFDLSGSLEFKNLFSGTKLYGQFLKNTSSLDTGKLVGLRLKLFTDYALKMEGFENEATTLPATLVSPLYGGTNREGYHLQFNYRHKNTSFALGHASLEAKEINPYQKQLKIVYFDLNIQI